MAESTKNRMGYFSDREIAPVLARLLRPRRRGRLLDLGAGWGNVSNSAAALGFEVVAVEQSGERLQFARERYPQVRFYEADVFEIQDKVLPFEGPFDYVIATEVIEHLFDPGRFLRLAGAALKEEGLLLLSTPYHGYLKNLLLALCNRMDDHYKALETGGHIKFFSRRTLERLLRDHGFEPLRFVGAGRLPGLWKSMVVLCAKSRPGPAPAAKGGRA